MQSKLVLDSDGPKGQNGKCDLGKGSLVIFCVHFLMIVHVESPPFVDTQQVMCSAELSFVLVLNCSVEELWFSCQQRLNNPAGVYNITGLSISQSASQPASHSVRQPVSQPVCLPVSQPVSHSASLSPSQSASLSPSQPFSSPVRMVSQTASQSVSQVH